MDSYDNSQYGKSETKFKLVKGRDLKNIKKFRINDFEENHNGVQYKTGYNIDHLEFNPSGKCSKGGLYFFDVKHITCYSSAGCWIREVTLDDDEDVWAEDNKYKAKKIILGERIKLSEFAIYDTNIGLQMVNQNEMSLRFIKNKQVCMYAVKQNGLFLEYIEDQDDDICIEAIKQNIFSLIFVKEQNNIICLEAINKSIEALEHIRDQNDMLCLIAINKNVAALKYIRNPNNKIYLEAINQNALVLEFITDQNDELCTRAVERDGLVLKFVRKQNNKICLEAVNQNGLALEYVEKQNGEICVDAVKQTKGAFKFVHDKYIELCSLVRNGTYLLPLECSKIKNDCRESIVIKNFMKEVPTNKMMRESLAHLLTSRHVFHNIITSINIRDIYNFINTNKSIRDMFNKNEYLQLLTLTHIRNFINIESSIRS